MIKGIFAPIPTPFKNGEIDYSSLKGNLEKWAKTPLSGVVVLGSNGEFAYLSHQEKVELVAFVRKNLPADKKVIAGTGCETTAETIILSNKVAEVGADAVLILTPYYYKGAMKDAALKAHFIAVADAVKLPVMLYNMPGNSGINMNSGLVVELAKHPNIVGVKDSSGNIVQIAEVCAGTTNEEFSVFAGSGSFLLPAFAVGAVGGTLAVANIMPETCVALVDAFQAGDLALAKKLQHKLLAPNKAVTAQFGIGGLKAALEMLGYNGGEVRKPMLPASEEAKVAIKKILETAGVI